MSVPHYMKGIEDPLKIALLELTHESKKHMHIAIFNIATNQRRQDVWAIELKDCDQILRGSQHDPIITITLSDMQATLSQRLTPDEPKSVDLRQSGSLEIIMDELVRVTVLYMESMVEKSMVANRKHYASFWKETIESYNAMPTWADAAN